MLNFHSFIVNARDTFVFHASDSFSNPSVQSFELSDDSGEWWRKIIHRPAYYSVELYDNLGIQVMGSFRQRPDLHFEFLFRLGTHPGGSVGDIKSQKLESVIEASNSRLFRTQL